MNYNALLCLEYLVCLEYLELAASGTSFIV